MPQPAHQGPVNPLPPVVAALFVLLMGIEAAFTLGARGLIGGPGAVGWRSAAIETYGFNAEIATWMVQNASYPGEHLMRFVTYGFVHGSFTHALFAGVLLLALGKFVGDVFRQWAVLVLFVVTLIAGAAAFALVAGPAQPWMVGAFPGVYGLIGGFTYLIWLRLGQVGAQKARAFTLIAVLMALQLTFGLLLGGTPTWVADASGFGCGFVLSFVLSPGGWARLRDRLRQR